MAETGLAQTMIGQTLNRLAQDFGLSVHAVHDLASMVGVSPDVLLEWHSGRSRPEAMAAVRLEQLAALHQHLMATFGSTDAVRAYLRSPLRALDGSIPLKVLCAGEIDRVEGALEALDSGIFF